MESKNNTKIVVGIIVVVAVVLAGVFMFGSSDKEISPSVPVNEENISAETSSAGIVEGSLRPEIIKGTEENAPDTYAYTIAASKDGFSPNEIRVTQGVSVTLVLSATDGAYDIAFEYPEGARLEAEEGELSGALFFGVDEKGEFAFSCEKKCPEGKKISGTIIVE